MLRNEVVRAYLWHRILKLGFHPSGSDRNKWLYLYTRSLKDFWEVNENPQLPKLHSGDFTGQVDNSRFSFHFDYTIENTDKFAVDFLYDPNELMWTHDADHQYFHFPEPYFLGEYKQLNSALQQAGENDVLSVIDSLICHPMVHQHIHSPIDAHQIRIGGGIGNPFLFLFHLRYQLCPFNDKRQAERTRLVTLFFQAIRNQKDVTINDLMQQPS